MKSEKELRLEIRQIRERIKSLSGFWIGEASAAIYALEWTMGKHETPPSEDLGRPRGGREKIAVSLVKIVEEPRPAREKPGPSRAVKPSSRPSPGKRSKR